MLEKLKALIPNYKAHKQDFDRLKKITESENSQIKEIMLAENLDKIEVDGIQVLVSTSCRESFDEDLLLATIKDLGLDEECVKTKEYVDLIALESIIYNGKLDAKLLEKCQIKKEVTTLRVK